MDNTTTIALSRLSAQTRTMDVIANNIANVSTPGFRAERSVFADWLVAEPASGTPPGGHTLIYTQDRATYRDQSEGTLTHTGNPLDLALSGPGFFQVQTPGGIRLTRAGRFSLQADGTIGDTNGNPVLDPTGRPITVAAGEADLTIAADGSISGRAGQIGRIGIVDPTDPNQLQAEGGKLFVANTPTRPSLSTKLVQGAVEDSNVQPIGELVNMISTERDFQFVSQFVEAEGTRQQNAIDKIPSLNT